ncbi:hypothetical protein [Enhygromyxa salina]|uniref:Lipoprotein n=1 Tax=Enhygromyxa salina TaxID=215803 RepID=A0A2S9YMA8_9BACT|nr:hypothetical protein [Enhygromyxa salina]PRQ06223.1 hypothetical protein ENSA7_40710 [Enhygromyxa salina]
MRNPLSYLGLLLPLCLALACDKPADDKKTDEKTTDDKKTAEKKEAPAEPEKPAEPEAPAKPDFVMTEHDLSTIGPEWAGWVAQGPKSAKVMGDLGKAARIAAGKDGFDLIFLPTKTDFAEVKAMLQKSAEANKTKIEFTIDTPELLEWTTTGDGWVSYSFQMNMTAGEQEITCKNLNGSESQLLVEVHKGQCATLVKK